VLTPEQAAKFEQMHPQRPDGQRHEGHRPPPMDMGNPPDNMQQGRGKAPMGGHGRSYAGRPWSEH
jgi:hypothetical protein